MSKLNNILALEDQIIANIKSAKEKGQVLLNNKKSEAEAQIQVFEDEYKQLVKKLNQKLTEEKISLDKQVEEEKKVLKVKLEYTYQKVVERYVKQLKKEVFE